MAFFNPSNYLFVEIKRPMDPYSSDLQLLYTNNRKRLIETDLENIRLRAENARLAEECGRLQQFLHQIRHWLKGDL
jgi:t-SNARE complex subunit (syntaxin)